MEGLKIGDQVYSSRLLIGSSGYPNFDVMLKAIKMSEANIVTVAIRRVKLKDLSSENLYSILKEENCTVLPNTAGSNPSGSGNNDQQGQIVTHHQIQNQNQNNNPVNLIPHQNPVHDDQSSAI